MAVLTYLIGLGAIAGIIVGATWKVYSTGVEAGEAKCKSAQAHTEEVVKTAREAMRQDTAQMISDIRVTHTTVKGQVERVIQKDPVFVDCRSGPAAMELFNSSIGPAGDARPGPGAAPGGVPASNPTR